MHSSVCSSLLCIRESPSVSPLMLNYSKLRERMYQKPLVPTARISGDCNQTWPESGTSGCAGFGIFKGLWQTRGLKNKVQRWPVLSCVIRKFLYPKDLSLKFMHIFTDDQRTFWLFFAFYFTTYCYNSRMHYRNLECPNETVWMFNLDQNFRGNSFTRSYKILNSRIVNDFQDSKVLTSNMWRHNQGNSQTGLETNICSRRLQGPSQLSTPFYSQLILRIYAAMNGLGGGAKTEFAPGRGKP